MAQMKMNMKGPGHKSYQATKKIKLTIGQMTTKCSMAGHAHHHNSLEAEDRESPLTMPPSSPSLHSLLLQPVQKGVPKKYKEVILEDSIVFCCPGCHELDDRATRCNGKQMFCPYWVRFHDPKRKWSKSSCPAGQPSHPDPLWMSSCSEVNDDPLAIIHLYLTSMDPHGSPPCLMASLVEQLWCAQFTHILLFISTHSHESLVADEVAKFFETILCGGIMPFLNGGILVIKFEDSFTSLQTALVWFPICDCIAFVMPHFQAPLTNIFLLTLFRSKIIQLINFSASFPHALEWDLELGAHTDIMYFFFNCSSLPPIMSMTCDKYVWWNANMWPYGHNIPFLCPTCASEGEAWTIQCSNPDCGLNADKSQFQPRARVSGEKLANLTFVMPSNKRTNGWIHFRVVDVKTTLA
ncbi:hypothetical protein V8B97DRAFT_2027073 [Scleroderma yunnanense]